jgi:hypothetical protein
VEHPLQRWVLFFSLLLLALERALHVAVNR